MMVLIAAPWGCSDDQGSVGGGRVPNQLFTPWSGPVAPEEWAEALAASACANFESCRAVALEEGYAEGEPCEQLVIRTLEADYDVVGALEQGLLQWDADAVGECVSAYAQAPCGSLWWDYRRPCLDGLGRVPEAGACLFDFECAEERFCDTSGACPGICTEAFGEGSACVRNQQCAAGSICAGYSEEATCQPELHRGERCDFDAEHSACAEGLFCRLLDGYDHTGSCEPRSAIYDQELHARGEECFSGGSSFLDWPEDCAIGLHCLAAEIVLEGEWTLSLCGDRAPLGGRCIRDDDNGNNPCQLEEYCESSATATEGTCRPRKAVGESCEYGQQHQCVLGSACDLDSGVCVSTLLRRDATECDDERTACYADACLDAGSCVRASGC